MVHVARGRLDARRAILARRARRAGSADGTADRFPAVGFHWLLGALRCGRRRRRQARGSSSTARSSAGRRRRLYGPEYAARSRSCARGHAALRSDDVDDADRGIRRGADLVSTTTRARCWAWRRRAAARRSHGGPRLARRTGAGALIVAGPTRLDGRWFLRRLPGRGARRAGTTRRLACSQFLDDAPPSSSAGRSRSNRVLSAPARPRRASRGCSAGWPNARAWRRSLAGLFAEVAGECGFSRVPHACSGPQDFTLTRRIVCIEEGRNGCRHATRHAHPTGTAVVPLDAVPRRVQRQRLKIVVTLSRWPSPARRAPRSGDCRSSPPSSSCRSCCSPATRPARRRLQQAHGAHRHEGARDRRRWLLVIAGVHARAQASTWPCWSVLFLMAVQATFFSPAKYGIVPEIAARRGPVARQRPARDEHVRRDRPRHGRRRRAVRAAGTTSRGSIGVRRWSAIAVVGDRRQLRHPARVPAAKPRRARSR